MPELPEVETIVRGLEPRIKGAGLAGMSLLWPPLLRRASDAGLSGLEGATVTGLRRRGKLAVIELDGGRALVFHLKMTGQLLLARPGAPVDKHVRLVVRFSNRDIELRFRDVRKFGFLCCLGPGESAPELDRLGPEPLETGREAFAALIGGRRGRIKSVLLDQRVIAGIGNIYADEILFASGIDPRAEASSLGPRRLERLWSSVREVLEEAISFKGTTVRDFRDGDGFEGLFQNRLRVYGRDGEPCPRCKAPIRRLRISGRSAHFCPRCQRR